MQGLDGVGLKQAVMSLAGAETIRWLEWGLQSYFRVLLGLTFMLAGAAILAGRLVPVAGLGGRSRGPQISGNWGRCGL